MTIIGITMGCPAGIGPEIVLRYFAGTKRLSDLQPVVLGDIGVLEKCASQLQLPSSCIPWVPGTPVPDRGIPVFQLSDLEREEIIWGQPSKATGLAMARYIEAGVELSLQGLIHGITTCPISKASLNEAGYHFPGHTEMLASLTGSNNYAMMMAGSKLKVTLVTIHCPLRDVSEALTEASVFNMISITHRALMVDFGIKNPSIGVAGFNPHGGENRLFGSEEEEVIGPAVKRARKENINVSGPYPPDTVFFKAASGAFDAVVCMYHDQGLIPFKLLHFEDGVNVTLGLSIVRTSVDHGTAYDIAGKGLASHQSLREAVNMAAVISSNRASCES
jgi:4-hydroxythreonine-4-phosphate dehydrogenase